MGVDRVLKQVERCEFENRYGRGVMITYRSAIGPRQGLAAEQVPLDRRLDLVRGVGPKTWKTLSDEGYTTLAELARHPRFGRDAKEVWAALAKRDARRLGEAGARDVELLRLFPRSDIVVIDIESTGLWQVLPLFLVGVAVAAETGWEVTQFLARSFDEEPAVLKQVLSQAGQRRVCVSYNGKAFDEPFVRARLHLHGLEPLRFPLHVDLLHAYRRMMKGRLPDCRLTTVARHVLGMKRNGDIPGSAVPDLYFEYVRDGDERVIAPVLQHNAADVLALAWLLDAGDFGLFGAGADETGSDEQNGSTYKGVG